MTVTLNGIDIETLIGINEIQRPRLATTPLGIHSLQLAQSMKATIHQYDVRCIWTGGNADYNSKKRKLQNIADAGLPVWFDATDWSKNTIIFGKVSDVQVTQSEGRPDIWDVQFLITAVFPWGYMQITEDGNGDFRIMDTDEFVQSRTLNPILRNCEFDKSGVTSGNLKFTFVVKNIGASSGQVKIEFMVPDNIEVADVSVLGGSPTIAVGDLGSAGISNTPGSLRRVTLTETINAGVDDSWAVTVAYTNLKTSFLDGSVDDIVG